MFKTNPFSIFIADDHPIVLNGLRTLLQSKGYTVSESATNGIEAFNKIQEIKPDIALLDLDMPGMTGMEIAEKSIREKSKTKFIILTLHRELSILRKCQEIGISGYLLKDFALDEIESCIENVIKGNTFFSKEFEKLLSVNTVNEDQLSILTPSERKILMLISQRRTSKEIASMLFISEKTVEKHRSNIIHKLDLPNDRRSLIELSMQMNKNKF